jgi:hypothetical protein
LWPHRTAGGSEEEDGGAPAVAVAGADAANAGSWPCCDQCGFCYRSYPPKCQCLDISHQGCHPACRNCVKYTAGGGSSSTHDELPVYRCADILTNFCERRCTPTVAAAAI